MTEAQKAESDFVTVHMPAWVAFQQYPTVPSITVLREPVGRTVSHLRQMRTFLHQTGEQLRSLEELFDDPTYFDRLSNYQTHVLSLSRDGHGPEVALEDRDKLDPEEVRPMVLSYFAVSLPVVEPASRDSLAKAKESLNNFTLVGTTDRLVAFEKRVADLLEVPSRPIQRMNEATDNSKPSAALLRRIEEANRLDRELYEAALALD